MTRTYELFPFAVLDNMENHPIKRNIKCRSNKKKMLKFLLRIVHGKHAYDVYMARNFKQCNTIKGYLKQNQTEYEKKYSCIKIFVLKNVYHLTKLRITICSRIDISKFIYEFNIRVYKYMCNC